MAKAVCILAFLLFSVAGISQTNNTVNTSDSVSASFPGGKEGWQQFLNKNLRFPQELIDKTRGRKPKRWEVIINFMVTKEGKLKNLTPETNFGNGLEEEAVRVLRKSPAWVPATIKGQAIDSYVRQPFVFVLEIAR